MGDAVRTDAKAVRVARSHRQRTSVGALSVRGRARNAKHRSGGNAMKTTPERGLAIWQRAAEELEVQHQADRVRIRDLSAALTVMLDHFGDEIDADTAERYRELAKYTVAE
jgi:hypothetical protein